MKMKKIKLVAYNELKKKCYCNISIPCKPNISDWLNSTFYKVDVLGPVVLG